MEFEVVNDGSEVDVTFANNWGLPYFDVRNGKAFVNFVGMILAKDRVLYSFPKHYNHTVLTITQKTQTMRKILNLITSGLSSDFDRDSSTGFPIDSYQKIKYYYIQHGLHFISKKEYKKGHSGRIDWKRTIRKSNKVIQKNGIVFLPFITVKEKKINEFLSDCMEFVLDYVYNTFNDYLDFPIPYSKAVHSPIFDDFTRCVIELKKIRNQYFKDSEKSLVDSLIHFFEWRSKHKGVNILATSKFENIWEMMVENYLNNKFDGIDDQGNIIWGEKHNIVFSKPKKKYIESIPEREKSRGFKIEFDHFYEDRDNKIVYLLDSKYIYKESFSEFNYKQAFYYYYLKQFYSEDYCIYNGLIAPSEGDYRTKVHVNRISGDRMYNDGLVIIEHYLNLKDVIDFTLRQ